MTAFDPGTRRWVPVEFPGAVPVPVLQGGLRSDEASLVWAAEDFGHMVHRRPRAVLRPASVADVAAVLRFAARVRLSVAARGAGHSPYGQAQATGGIVIDTTALDRIGEVRDGLVTVQAGATWAAVLDAALAAGYTPPVLTDYLHTTVGGTLAVGGVGGGSHRHGFQVDTVADLEVVTGDGRVRTCSPGRDPRLFSAVLGGLGRCGVLTAATLRLAPAPERVRWLRLRYRDLGTFLADQRHLVRTGRFAYLEGQVLIEDTGPPYLIEAAAYHPAGGPPDVAALLAGLGHDPDGLEVQDVGYRDFQHRMAPGEAALLASGEWCYPHAWLTVFLPDGAVAEVVAGDVAGLRRADLGESGLVLLYPLRPDRRRTPFPRLPDGEVVWLLGLLRTASADDPTAGAGLVAANRAVLDRAIAAGGVAYPANTLPMAEPDWRALLGPHWAGQVAAVAEYDPHRILAPGQGPLIGPAVADR